MQFLLFFLQKIEFCVTFEAEINPKIRQSEKENSREKAQEEKIRAIHIANYILFNFILCHELIYL